MFGKKKTSKGDENKLEQLKREIGELEKAKEATRQRRESEERDSKARGRTKPVTNEQSKQVNEQNEELTEKDLKFMSRPEKLLLKKQIITERLKEYTKTTKINAKETFTPIERDIKEYKKILNDLKLPQLKLMGQLIHAPLKLDLMDRIKSYNKKEHAVVTIFNDNQTTDTGVIHCYDRTFSRHEMTYLVMSERGRYDPEFKMMHFYYYANQPCPLDFKKGKMPENTYDSRLIDDTIQMKVIEALAAVDMEKYIKITLVCIILNLIMTAIQLMMAAKDAGVFSGVTG